MVLSNVNITDWCLHINPYDIHVVLLAWFKFCTYIKLNMVLSCINAKTNTLAIVFFFIHCSEALFRKLCNLSDLWRLNSSSPGVVLDKSSYSLEVQNITLNYGLRKMNFYLFKSVQLPTTSNER